MGNKVSLKDIKSIVYEATKRMLKEDILNREYPEGSPQKPSDVITGNGWTGETVSRSETELVLRVYKNSGSATFGDTMSLEELVDDLNTFYEHKNYQSRAESAEEYNGEEGSFIIVRK